MNKSILIFLFLFFFLFLLSVGIFIYQSQIFSKPIKAQSSVFSPENSYIFVNPVQASANGEEKIRLTVFVLDFKGLGIYGKHVTLSQNPRILIQPINSYTDETGKAVFDISSSTKGEYLISVIVDSVELVQKARLSFL